MIKGLGSYGIVGLIATAVYLVASSILVLFELSATLASVLGYCLSSYVSYVLYRRFTFQSNIEPSSDMPRVALVMVMVFALSNLFPAFLAGRLLAPHLVSFLAVAVCVPMVTFLSLKYFVFKA